MPKYLPLGHQSPWYGAFWKVAACACFAGINGAVRCLSGGSGAGDALPTHELAFFQNLIGLFVMVPWVWKDRGLLKTDQLPTHLMRAALSVAGIVLWYTALKYMEIAQAVALNFTGPIFTILWARVFLGELIPGGRWFAIALGFAGTFIAGRPDIALRQWGSELFQWVSFVPLLSAATIAGSYILSKKLVAKDSPQTIALFLLLLMTPMSMLPCFFEWQTPQLWQVPLLVGMGILTVVAHFSLNKALMHADVTFLIPFGLSRIFFSASVGFLLFSEIPSTRVWIGTLVIICAILSLDYSSSFRSKKPAPAID